MKHLLGKSTIESAVHRPARCFEQKPPGAVRNDTVLADRRLPPSLICDAGPAATFAWEEFAYARIRNPNTRIAYVHAICKFLAHCRSLDKTLTEIAPVDVARYLDGLSYAMTTKKLHLAALRHFFDTLVTRHVVVLNPAASVRSDRVQIVEGRTPEIGVEQARRLLRSIPIDSVVGARDRAVIAILVYTAARVGAVTRLRRRDFFEQGGSFVLRFTEKGGKLRELPVRHDLRTYLHEYLAAGHLEYAEPNAPMFRTTYRRSKRLTARGMSPCDVARMLKRRLHHAGLSMRVSAHSFRVTVITDLLMQGVSLEDVQNLAGHADPRTTRLYDRRHRVVTQNIVERISV
ncbi:MAG: tyrosine-type recombinase/integrase [Planctomycetales bacterium]|nr:tyrosine-type recombinase/integrase [Planctomycetales bacterium]